VILETERELLAVNQVNRIRHPDEPAETWTPIIACLINDRNRPDVPVFNIDPVAIVNAINGDVQMFTRPERMRRHFCKLKDSFLAHFPNGLPRTEPDLVAALAPLFPDMAALVAVVTMEIGKDASHVWHRLVESVPAFYDFPQFWGMVDNGTNIIAASVAVWARALIHQFGPDSPLYVFMMQGERSRRRARSLWAAPNA
jgi:hypothetical protein